MNNGETKTAKLAAVLIVAMALIAAACGSETPEQLSNAIEDASTTLAFADVAEEDCIGTTIVDAVGFETLQAEAISAEAVRTDPEVVEQLINDDDELRARVAECLDPDLVFRTALGDLAAEPVDCAEPFTNDDEFVAALTHKAVTDESPRLRIPDEPDIRDLLRPCLTSNDFSDVFGLDRPDELIQAIGIELAESVSGEAESECLGATVVEAFGVEGLESLEVTAEHPSVDIPELEAADDLDLVDSLGECVDYDAINRSEFLQLEPMLGDCMAEGADTDLNKNRLRNDLEIEDTERVMGRMTRSLAERCYVEHVEELFGEDIRFPFDREADVIAGWFFYPDEDFASTAFTLRCAAYAMIREVGLDEVTTDFEVFLNTPWGDPAGDAAFTRLAGQLHKGKRVCLGDWPLLAENFVRGGISVDSLDCAREVVGESTVSELIDLFDESFLGEPTALENARLARLFDHIIEAVESCISADEQRDLDKLLDWINGSSFVSIDEDGVIEA